ncbi:hypothetical protein [Pacificoceanicola onchidii]|uniref:hypothetical protein n=1 Tax=Pacificoceanicola onchidii TaxID=2562685 RepID=UPI0010A5B041|nr:hypothetical protein [Pacificoceanicola onchidii]
MQDREFVDPEPLRILTRRFEIGFRVAFALTCAVAVAMVLALLASPDWIGGFLAEATGYPLEAPRLWQGAAFVGIALSVLAAHAAVFRAAGQVCRWLVQGLPARAAGAAQQLSRRLWWLLGLSILAHTASVLVATAHAGPGQRAVSLALGSSQITFAIAALIAAFLARAFVLGAALWQDHQEIV